MQVLISQNCFQDLMQYTYSPKEILVNLKGKFERNIFYLVGLETLLIGEKDFIPSQQISKPLIKALRTSNIIGFYHTHPNLDSNGNSLLSGSDINFFNNIYSYWDKEVKKDFPLLLGVGSTTSENIGVLYDIKFYILSKTGQPQELISHIIS